MCEILQSVKDQLNELENEFISKKDEDYIAVDDNLDCALLNMPVEIILNICSFLDPHFLRNTLSKVCKRFDDILADEHLWKTWIHTKVKGAFPPLPHLKLWEEVEVDWEEICVEMDIERKKWSNVNETMKHVVVRDVHFASVDTVLLVNKGEVCVSGGRDRGMALWNIQDIKSGDIVIPDVECSTTVTDTKPRHIRYDAHSGWVWDLAPDNMDAAKKIFSASWDNTVKAWDLETGFECIETFQCGMSALSVVAEDNMVMAGLYSKKVLSFDLRVGSSPISSYKPHRGPVLDLHCYKNMVASVSEDKTLAVWDKIAGKLIANDVKIPTEKAYPVCISWCPTALYIGDSKGCIHLINPEDNLYLKTHEVWPEPPIIMPSSKITSCCQSQGTMVLCSDRGEIKFLYNCYPPQEYASIKTSTSDVTQMRYLNNVLVVGTCDSALEFWIPSDRYYRPPL
ncbi:F-box/WD repeat-containing protein 9-like [Plodia interpunctella]|uniref:F-box/WD repeat-containing protein 9-like n=1 Tax=Plodia interpunctella TaxID=58824 RepID=UPI002367AB14|nr:F-box/WD repeat-containing protein 9-like [Plodia interpunctella]XP_053615328.1 F-box/WD repeat-containing protein 9-like [Plodia interpunctella]XP_053615338.1 F-box/WD repeat-containing protein 9-like [Plodia interpunctella]XP_053615346.1 F-box/WD repeat-containing protein 9-like [Plodia interpunctella]XP_053615357.1 F-box/WD repeat-containing protein 9-like [Plodia interpunctella]XP_053615368.1 F-box/WD repeat-containing protein 9-like [Plodia interpunctella]XP_053615376.1 F-box/WD repea